MRKIIIIITAILMAGICRADDYRTWTITSHSSTSSIAMTNFANPFVGEIDEISVYGPAGVTGAVQIAAVNPYSGVALILGSNATLSTNWVWRPKVDEPLTTGSQVLVVTNTTTDDRFYAMGESIRATLSAVSTTSAVFRVFIKIK